MDTRRATWLRQDLLTVLEMIARARVEAAQGLDADRFLQAASSRLATVIASPDIPELADLLADLRSAFEKEPA